jgi:hypothetical protein
MALVSMISTSAEKDFRSQSPSPSPPELHGSFHHQQDDGVGMGLTIS